MRLREVGGLLRAAGTKFLDDKGTRLGAALAYYTALSLSPLLLVVVAIAGLAFGQEAARGEIVAQLRGTIGTEGATVVEQLVTNSSKTSHGIIATTIAVLVLVYGATSVFSSLQSALNTIWRVPGPEPASGIWATIKQELLSFSLVCGTAFLLLASLVVSALISAVDTQVAGWLPGMDVLAQWVNTVVTFVLLTILFAMIYKLLPEARLTWSDVWVGAGITAALFSLGKYLIGLYLGRAAIGSTYGAAGAFVVLLVWIYYSAQILLFGAELTFVYATKYGRGVVGVPLSPQPTVPATV